MNDAPLHVVLGVGQVGRAVADQLIASGAAVRAVSRHRPPNLPETTDWRQADLTDVESAADAVKGAAVVYQCLNVPYTQWPQLFPPLQHTVLAASERAEAVLVTLENVYGYGSTGGRPLTEDLPLAATTSKGRTRAAMTAGLLAAAEAGRVRMTIGRASDFFGPGVVDATLGSRVFGNAVAGKRADFLGNPELLHTYSYVPDIAAGLIRLGTDDRAIGQVWHLPGPESVTTRQLLDVAAQQLGHSVEIRSIPAFLVRVLGVVSPMMRSLAEMSYEFDEPFVLDTSKFSATFGTATTPLVTAIADTLGWYRAKGSTL